MNRHITLQNDDTSCGHDLEWKDITNPLVAKPFSPSGTY